MEARRASESVVEVPREVEVDEKAHVYGSRWVEVETAEGGTRFEEVPLTWDDLFDPQEGDHVPHGDEHHTVISRSPYSPRHQALGNRPAFRSRSANTR